MPNGSEMTHGVSLGFFVAPSSEVYALCFISAGSIEGVCASVTPMSKV